MIKKYFEDFWNISKKTRKAQITKLLDRNKNASLLDLGCDDGSFTKLLAEKIDTNKKYGIEINDIAINKAKKTGISIKKSDLNFKFDFSNSFFDVVVADQVIEHLWNLDNFASEIYRILRPSGYTIISTENLASWHNIGALLLGLQPFTGPTISSKEVVGFHPLTPTIKSMAKKYSHTPNMPPHTKVLTLTALVSLFKLHNFKVEQVKVSGYFPFTGLIGKLLAQFDKRHAFFITIKARKINS